jgi:ankyrin repeat protein
MQDYTFRGSVFGAIRWAINVIVMCFVLMLSAVGSFALPACEGVYVSSTWSNCSGGAILAPGIIPNSGGNYYEGDWKNGKPDGFGFIQSKNGHVFYIGGWKNGNSSGQGTYKYSDGSTYVGEWLNDYMNGRGTFTFSDGSTLVGEWKDGEFANQGTFTNADGTIEEGILQVDTCRSNASLCTLEEVCANATNIKSDIRIWETADYWVRHVLEAQRRGLTCGVELDHCENFNSIEFFSNLVSSIQLGDTLQKKLFLECSEKNGGQLLSKKNNDYNIPLFYALKSNVPADFIDKLVPAKENILFDDFSKIKDPKGRDALMLAIDEGASVGNVLRLVGLGWDVNQAVLDYALNANKPHNTLIALLLALGVKTEKKADAQINDTQALLFKSQWRAKLFTEWTDTIVAPDPPLGEYNVEDCAVTKSSFVRELTLEQFKFCLKVKKIDPITVDQNGNSILHLISEHSVNAALIDMLMTEIPTEKLDFIINQTNAKGDTPLDIAVKKTLEPSIVTRLLAWGATPNSDSRKSWWQINFKSYPKSRPIHLAALRKDELSFDLMVRLLAGGANMLLKDEIGNTALHNLLKKCRQVQADETNENTCSPTLPVSPIDVQKIELLLEVQNSKSKILSIRNDQGATPLSYAALNNLDYDIIEKLLKYGADPDSEDQEGVSPIFQYTNKGSDADTFKVLLNASKNVCKKMITGATIEVYLDRNEALKNDRTKNQKYPAELFRDKCKL